MKVQISDADGKQEVLLDGQPIYCMTVSTHHRGGCLPEVVIQPDIIEAGTLAEPDRVILPEGTVDLLKRLGWTPPAEQG